MSSIEDIYVRFGVALAFALICEPALGQPIEPRHFCDPVENFLVAPISKADPALEVAKIEVEVAPGEIIRPSIERPEVAKIEIERPQVAKIDRCFTPGHIGTRFLPERMHEIQRQYADAVRAAGPTAAQLGLQNVELGVEKYLFENVGGPPPTKVLGFNGRVINNNPFPLRSVSITCGYINQFNLQKTIPYTFTDILGPGRSIGYVDKVLGEFPSAAKTFPECKVESIEVWRDDDDIQSIQ